MNAFMLKGDFAIVAGKNLNLDIYAERRKLFVTRHSTLPVCPCPQRMSRADRMIFLLLHSIKTMLGLAVMVARGRFELPTQGL